MKIKNLKVNSESVDPKLKIKREFKQTSARVFASMLTTAVGMSVTRAVYDDPNTGLIPFIVSFGLLAYSAKSLFNNLDDFIELKDKQKKKTK